MRELGICVDHDLVGTLGEDNNIWVLDYDPAWAARDGSFDLSPALPCTSLHHLDGATLRPVQWYFDNLLPKGELRRAVAQDAGVKDQDDAFALQRRILRVLRHIILPEMCRRISAPPPATD